MPAIIVQSILLGSKVSGGLYFLKVVCKIKAQLNRIGIVIILVIAIHVLLELVAVTYDLLPSLLKGDAHVVRRSVTNICP